MRIQNPTKAKRQRALRRARRVRACLHGTAHCPRVTVKRSLKHIYVQVIDDEAGRTLAAASDFDVKEIMKSKVDLARAVGKVVGERAKEKKVSTVIFDRSGYRYHGRVAALAEGAREAGLEF
ncbi:MAG TPA: 50S ribosomal protein L18 [Patescibacteria group bacterium]|nr:50S ribosomal protein L18 [Patescibacteria group bacterium]